MAPQIPKLMKCIVCCKDYYPFCYSDQKWEHQLTQEFYNLLKIPKIHNSFDEDSALPLSFCPECYSRISVMFTLSERMKTIEEEFEKVRNEIAFTVVRTISCSRKHSMMDHIRVKIFNAWRAKFLQEGNQLNVNLDSFSKRNFPLTTNGDLDQPDDEVSSGSDFDNLHIRDIAAFRVGQKRLKSSAMFLDAIGYLPKLFNIVIKYGSQGKFDMGNTIYSPASDEATFHEFEKMLKNLVKFCENEERLNKIRERFNPPTATAPAKKTKLSTEVILNKDSTTTETASVSSRVPSHQGSSKPESSLKCLYCKKYCTSLKALRRHQSLAHPSLRKHQCHKCGKGFLNAMNWRRHIDRVHGEVLGQLKCPFCEKEFMKVTSYRVHIKVHIAKNDKKLSHMMNTPLPEFSDLEDESNTNGKKSSKHHDPTKTVTKVSVKKNNDNEAEDKHKESGMQEGSVALLQEENKCKKCDRRFLHPKLLKLHLFSHEKARKNSKKGVPKQKPKLGDLTEPEPRVINNGIQKERVDSSSARSETTEGNSKKRLESKPRISLGQIVVGSNRDELPDLNLSLTNNVNNGSLSLPGGNASNLQSSAYHFDDFSAEFDFPD